MAGDTEIVPGTETPPATPPAPPAPEPAPPAEVKPPHPLEAGGVRFNEVYANWRAAEARAQTLQAELERRAPVPPAAPAPKVWTETELQALVDQSRITPAQMASQLAMQTAAASEQRILQRIEQQEVVRSATAEVEGYLTKIPALADQTSPQFHDVSRAAREISRDMNLPVTDPRVQKQALRSTFGSLDKLATVSREDDYRRRQADTHVEQGGGGGAAPPGKDPLKDVHPAYLAEWQRTGKSRAEMIELAKYIRRPVPRGAR